MNDAHDALERLSHIDLEAIGDAALLRRPLLGLFCSVRCPGSIILQTYDLALALRDAGVATIGGFHSPMEKECLRLLLRGRQPVVVCPARSISDMRVPGDWKAPVAEGRLLVVSPFAAHQRRQTVALAEQRNRFVAGYASAIFIAYANPGGKTEAFAREVIASGKPVYTFDCEENVHLLDAGARSLTAEDAGSAVAG